MLALTPYPSRAEWLAARRQSLGGSDTPKLLGLSRWGDGTSVFADKLGLLPDEPEAQEAARWGLLLEPLVAARYQEETGLEVQDPGPFVIARDARYPFLHCSPDRFVVHPTRGRGLLSLKTTSAYKRAEWSDEAPPAYQVQCQHEMLVTDLSWSAIAVLIGGQTFRFVDCLERDDRFLKRLVPTLEAFWAALQRREPPPATASEACRQVLAALYPTDTGETIALAPALLQVDEDWIQAKAELDAAQARKDLAENLLRAALGAATRGVLPNGVSWSNKRQHRNAFEMPASDYRVLRRARKG